MNLGKYMKHLLIKNKKELKEIIEYLIAVDTLPKINTRLNIFSEDDEIKVEIIGNELTFRKNERSKQIKIKNKNIKYFFKTLDLEKKYYINEITMLNYSECSILFDTYHGTIISFLSDDLCMKVMDLFKLELIDNINEHNMKKNIKSEYLFDQIGNINKKIKVYANKTGLDIRSVSSSLKIRMSNLSNDYSFIEKKFKFIIGQELLSTNSIKKEFKIKEMSIIIPVYNQDVAFSLLSIQGQKISKEDKQKLQVIIINDGSKNDVINDINKVKNKLDFEVDIISFSKNMGLSNARNAGLAIAKNDLILFMDSDIILSENYIRDINIRLQLIPNAIFICMRKNIKNDSKILNDQALLKGTKSCFDFDDSRVITKGKDYHIGCDKLYGNEEISVLDDTDYFKELGFGSQIEIYNISTVVTGHNIAINREMIKSNQPFENKFKGWGMEDSYFASKLISEGCFVIPVLSSCVYHIEHPPRSGSNEKKNEEALRNYNLYSDLINKNWA